jgi:hypothetical protein
MPLPFLVPVAIAGIQYAARYAAVKGARKLLSYGARKILKKTGKFTSQYGGRAVTGAFYADAVNEASKGNYEPLTYLSMGGIPGAGKVISKIPGVGKKLESIYARSQGRTVLGGPGMGIDDAIVVTRGAFGSRINKAGKVNKTWRRIKVEAPKDKSGPIFDVDKQLSRQNTTKSFTSTKAKKQLEVSTIVAGKKRGGVYYGAQTREKDIRRGSAKPATYLPNTMGKGSSILGWKLKNGKPTHDKPVISSQSKDYKAFKAQERYEQSLKHKKIPLKASYPKYSYELVGRTKADIIHEIKTAKSKAAKRVAQYKIKGDDLNRLYVGKDKSSQIAAKIFVKEGKKIGVNIKVMDKPSSKISNQVDSVLRGKADYLNREYTSNPNKKLDTHLRELETKDVGGKMKAIRSWVYAQPYKVKSSPGKAMVFYRAQHGKSINQTITTADGKQEVRKVLEHIKPEWSVTKWVKGSLEAIERQAKIGKYPYKKTAEVEMIPLDRPPIEKRDLYKHTLKQKYKKFKIDDKGKLVMDSQETIEWWKRISKKAYLKYGGMKTPEQRLAVKEITKAKIKPLPGQLDLFKPKK